MSTQPVPTLVLCADAWHPEEMIRQGLTALEAPGFAFEFVTQGDRWSEAMMESFRLVVVAKANHVSAADRRPWLTAETQSAFRQFVRNGGGLVALHGGVCYQELPDMRGVTGGAFLRHPDQCPVTVVPQTGHPLTHGVRTFTVLDEHYCIELDMPDTEVFLRSSSAHGIQPAGWLRREGTGRVLALTPGHHAGVWGQPDFQTLLRNGLAWAAGDH